MVRMYHIPVSGTLFCEKEELGVLGVNFGLVLYFIFSQIVDVIRLSFSYCQLLLYGFL